MIKSFVPAVILASVFATPAVSFAQQSDAPLTRAQVRAQIVQLEKAGYNPVGGVSPYYPSRTQAAEARVEAQNAASSSSGGASLAADTSAPAAGTKQTRLGS